MERVALSQEVEYVAKRNPKCLISFHVFGVAWMQNCDRRGRSCSFRYRYLRCRFTRNYVDSEFK